MEPLDLGNNRISLVCKKANLGLTKCARVLPHKHNTALLKKTRGIGGCPWQEEG